MKPLKQNDSIIEALKNDNPYVRSFTPVMFGDRALWCRVCLRLSVVVRFLFVLAVVVSPAFGQSLTIPEGTQIAARLANQLDSGQVHVGDAVTMDVLEDLKINGAIAIPHGAIVLGHVTEAKGARKMGRGGKLTIAFETVTAGDGTKVPVSGENSAKGKGGYGAGSLVGAGAAGLLFPPAGALLLLKHGHASEMSIGTILTVHVTAATSVSGTAAKEIPVAPVVAVAKAAPPTMAPMEPQAESLGDYARRMKKEKP